MSSIKNPQSKIKNPLAILLAAGRGTRMGSEDLPKVLHLVAGRPMIAWVVDACREAGVKQCIIVIGHRGDLVRQALLDVEGCTFVEQVEQLGTGHAVQTAAPLFANGPARDVFVLAGDGPLIRARTLTRMLDVHRDTAAAATLATAILDDPVGYGRIVRDTSGGFSRIVEQKDATPDQLDLREVNPSYYCFQSDALFSTLDRVENQNASGEFYLTDVPGLLHTEGQTVSLVDAVPPEDVLSINTPVQLAAVDAILRQRHNAASTERSVAGVPS